MTRLYLIRHGAVVSGEAFYGQLDVPLSDEGREQLEGTAAALRDLDLAAIHCSDLQRTRDSAEILARPHGLKPVADPAFREMHLGVLEGELFAEAQQRHPQLLTKRYHHMWEYRFPGGGENLQDVADRVDPALRELLSAHPDQSVALVAHNSVNRVIIGRALGLPVSKVFDFSQDFGCINQIDYGKRARVKLVNWTPDAPGR